MPTENTKKWKTALYIRLSQEDVETDKSLHNICVGNKTESESVSSQRLMLTDFLKHNGDLQLVDEYVDDGYSGTTFFRPAVSRLIDDVKQKKIDCIVVKDLSRFGRNYIEVGSYLEVLFPLFQVRFIAIIDRIDSHLNPQSLNNISVPIKNIMNENYSRDLSAKVRTALDARKRQGLFVGSFAPYGYKKDELNKNKLIVDPAAAQTVKNIFFRFASGQPITRIAKSLNEAAVACPSTYKLENGCLKYALQYGKTGWNYKTIKRILQNPVYAGCLVQKKRETISYKLKKFRPVEKDRQICVENAVESIVDGELFFKVQNLLKKDYRIEKNANELSALSGFMQCGFCLHGMSKKKALSWNKTSVLSYFVCSTYKNCGPKFCVCNSIRADSVEACLLQFFKFCFGVFVAQAEAKTILENLQKNDDALARENNLLKIKTCAAGGKKIFISGLYPDYRAGIISKDEYLEYKRKAEGELRQLNAEIFEIKSRIDQFKPAKVEFNAQPEQLTRQIVSAFLQKVRVWDNCHLELNLTFNSFLEV